ncbi:hypothetical protein PHMEG_0002546 [Phytophthora megakarya]|uniref:Uncharacterized protein n=1 Tax=Phytophthora megakarya TaxID=4795 RepID=A0A225WY04_9STRA|nr:hypothetical protein PHMEG_0002546 [Phytophthora megakarya]
MPNNALLPAVFMHDTQNRTTSSASLPRIPLPAQIRFFNNHPSASNWINALKKNIREEQESLRCIVVDADLIDIWTETYVIPFGVICKVMATLICQGIPFQHRQAYVRALLKRACEITGYRRAHPITDVKMMAGYVAAAYGNTSIHSDCVHMFAGSIPKDNAIVINMSAAFWWSGSVCMYGVFGGAVAFMIGNTDAIDSVGFFLYHLVNNHINVALHVDSDCSNVNSSPHYTMIMVADPDAVNEEKFTPWNILQKVLRLMFATSASTAAMPASEIAKPQRIVATAIRSHSLTHTAYRSPFGSLRLVATCIRPARAFL